MIAESRKTVKERKKKGQQEENQGRKKEKERPTRKQHQKSQQLHRETGVERVEDPSQVQGSALLGSGVKPQKCNPKKRTQSSPPTRKARARRVAATNFLPSWQETSMVSENQSGFLRCG